MTIIASHLHHVWNVILFRFGIFLQPFLCVTVPFLLLVQHLLFFHLRRLMATPAVVFIRLIHFGIHDPGVVVQLPPS